MADAQTATDNNGQYAFTGLRAGSYGVEISGFDMDEVGFGSVSSSATVGVGESKIISFDGTYLRTAGIMGQVSVEGVGLAGVTVTMTGEGEDETDVTDAGGLYGFSKLKAGDYSVAISGFDPDEVDFTKGTSMNVTVALGETANIPFEGTLLRTSGISGRVSVEGMGIPDVTVTLAGAAEATYTTMDDGQYAFAGLAEGTYVVSMANPDETAYNFEMMSHTVPLGDAESAIRNFEGTHTRTASISGMLFIDEVMRDYMLTTGEPSITAALEPLVAHGLLDQAMLAGLLANAKVIVRGPSLNDRPMEAQIQADGSFAVGELIRGSYQVELPVNDDMVAAALAAAGVDFVGESMVVTVAAGGMAKVDFPFRITMQTIGVGAVMGNDEVTGADVEDVTLALFPTAQDAEDSTNELGKLPIPTKTGPTGMAAFHFARADDSSPGSDDSDNLVFVKVVETGDDDLRVSANDIIEIEYPGVARVHSAPARVRLVNVAVNVQFWVKSDKDARSGDEGLGGWKTEIFMGDPSAEDATALTKQDPRYPDDPTKTVNITDPTDDGEDVEADAGKTAFSYMAVDADGMPDLPATFYVTLPPYNKQSADGGEMWTSMADDEALGRSEDGSMLMYEHTGLMLPDDDAVDLGATRITFTTQKLMVGVYRETDDVPGFTDYRSAVPGGGGDTRPTGTVAGELQVELMVENSRGRLERYEYMSFDAKGKRTVDVANPKAFGGSGTASFPNLPADEEFTVRFQPGSDRAGVTHEDASLNGRDVDAYGDDLAGGMSVGGFGDMSGGGHTVSLCPLTTSDTPGQSANSLVCATFAYQWQTGKISGVVTLGGEEVGDKAVRLDAVTSGHSQSENTKTVKSGSAKGEYTFSKVQDGEYEVVVAETGDHGEKKSKTLVIYHNENTERTGDEITGTPAAPLTANIALSSTKLRIQGYVANDDGDGIVRGDEAVEGIVMELRHSKTDVVTGKAIPTGTAIQAVETGPDGFYDFPSVPERTLGYHVTAVATDYAAVVDDATDNVSNRVFPAPDRDIIDGEFDLPSWDYDAGTIKAGTHVVKPKELGNELAQFVNFALLHQDGKVTGRAREAAGNHEGITIELARCETVEVDLTKDDGRACESAPRSDFPVQRAATGKGGYWEFPDLMEGWYRANVGDAGFSPAMLDDDGDIDDDGDVPSQANYVKIVEGKLDVASRANFFVFDNTGDDDRLDSISVTGKTSIDDVENKALAATVTSITQHTDGETDISGATAPVITWASETIDVTPTVDADASFVVRTNIGTDLLPHMKVWGSGQGDVRPPFRKVTVEPNYYGTNHPMHGMARPTTVYVDVSAENGYNDHTYMFDIMRRAPVNNNLAELDFGLLRTAVNTAIPVPAITSGRGNVERVASVPVGTGTAATMSVFIKARMQEGQMGMVAEVDGTEIFPETSISGENDRIHRVYQITGVPRTGDIETVVFLTVTSEDDIDKTYEITLNRGVVPTTPTVTMSLAPTSISEAGGTSTLTATVSPASATAFAVTVSAAPVSAVMMSATTLSFAANATSATADVTITAVNNDVVGANPTVTVSGTTPSGVTDPADVMLTITDDDGVATTPRVTMSLAPTSISEAGGTSTLTATVSPASATAFDVTVSAAPLGAVTMSGTMLSFAANATSPTADVTITAVNNDVVGANPTVTVSGTTPSGVTGPGAVTLTITDDDETGPTGQQVTLVLDRNIIDEGGVSMVTARVSPASPTVFTVTVSAAPVSPAVVADFTLSGTTLTFAANATRSTGEVTITATTNTVDAPNKTVKVSGSVETADATAKSPAEVTITITDDDEFPGLPQGFQVEAGDQGAMLTWRAPSDIGSAPVNAYQYRRLEAKYTFRGEEEGWLNAGDGDARAAPVSGLQNGEPYNFQLRARNEVRNDENEGGGPAVSRAGTPWPAVTLEVDPVTIVEDGGESTVTARLTTAENTANRSFTVTVTAESTTPGAFTLSASTLTIAAGQPSSAGDVKITAVPNVVDADNVVTVSGTLSTGSAAPTDVTVTITDDDEAPSAPTVTADAVANSTTEIRLSWPPPAAGTSPITHFEYRSKATEALAETDPWMRVPGSNSGTGTYVVTGLTAATTYNFEVRAVSAAGDGAAGSETATTNSSQ